MPDLKTELKKLEALKFDDDGDTTVITLQPAVAVPDNQQGSISKRLFDLILNNPGCNRSSLLAKALSAGIGMSSSSSLIHQFTKRGLIRAVDNPDGTAYFCVGTQYKPGYIKQSKKAAKVATPKAAKPEPQPTAIAPVSLAVFSAKDMVESMPVGKARAVYDELKKLFGG